MVIPHRRPFPVLCFSTLKRAKADSKIAGYTQTEHKLKLVLTLLDELEDQIVFFLCFHGYQVHAVFAADVTAV